MFALIGGHVLQCSMMNISFVYLQWGYQMMRKSGMETDTIVKAMNYITNRELMNLSM